MTSTDPEGRDDPAIPDTGADPPPMPSAWAPQPAAGPAAAMPSRSPSAPADDTLTGRLKRLFAPVAAVGIFLAKFGAVLLKLKAFTVIGTMAVSIAAYATLWGWSFGLGFVLLIFVHEMGHVVALRRRGIRAGAPVFLPFLGAFVSMKEMPKNAYVEAETALAGPLVGTVGAFGVLWLGDAMGSAMLRDLAFVGFLLNLFNLLPALPLDGGRVAGALHPSVWLLGLGALLVVEFYRPSPVILIILLLGGYELYRRWRSRDTEASKVYFRLLPGQRLRIGAAYLGLVLILLIALHATYVERTL
jgi:Zn-dependent protease